MPPKEKEANFIPTMKRAGYCVIITLWLVILFVSFFPTAKCCPSADKCACFSTVTTTVGNGTATKSQQFNATCLTCDQNDKDTSSGGSSGCVVDTNSYIYCGTGHYHQPTAIVCYVIVGILITLGLCCTMHQPIQYANAGM